MPTQASQLSSDFLGDHLSVKMFGAVCDGVTDDAAAINDAISAAIHTGKDVLIPGLCGIGSTITGTGSGYAATSATSITPATGSITFTTQTGLYYKAGDHARASSAGSGAFLDGTVSSYSGTTLIISVTYKGGSGAHTDWAFSIIGAYLLRGTGMKESSTPTSGLKKLANIVALQLVGPDIHIRDLAVIGYSGGDTTDGIWVGDATHDASNAQLARIFVNLVGGHGILMGQANGVDFNVVCLACGGDGVLMADLAGTGNSNECYGRIGAVGCGGWGVELQGSSGNLLHIDSEGNGLHNALGGGILNNWTYNNLTVYTEGNGLLPTVNVSAVTQANPAQVTTSAYHGLQTGRSIHFAGVGGMTPLNALFSGVQVSVIGSPITAITQAGSAAVTTLYPHNFTTGDTVGFTADIQGMTQIRGLTGTVTVTGPNAFTVNINSSAFAAFIWPGGAGPGGGWVTEAYTFTIAVDTTGFSAYTSGGTIQQQTGIFLGLSGFGSTIKGIIHEGTIFNQGNAGGVYWDQLRNTFSYPQGAGALSGPSIDLNNATGPTQLTMEQSASQGSTSLVSMRDTSANPLWVIDSGGAFKVYNGFQSFRYASSDKYVSLGYHPTLDYTLIDSFDSAAGTSKPIVIGAANSNSRLLLHGDTDDGTTAVQINAGDLKVPAGNVITGATDMASLLALTASLQAQINALVAGKADHGGALTGTANLTTGVVTGFVT